MTLTQSVGSVLSQYATFSGRARRAEYWWFYLFTVLVGLAASAVDAALNTAFNNEIGIVGTVTSLGLLLPTIAVTARRLHDTGRTGWWMLLPVFPILATIVVGSLATFAIVFSPDADGTVAAVIIMILVGCLLTTFAALITLLVFLCLDSNPGPNRYGPSPKQPPMPPAGPSGYYYPPTGHSPQHPVPGYGQPHGYPQQPPVPPPSGFYPPLP